MDERQKRVDEFCNTFSLPYPKIEVELYPGVIIKDINLFLNRTLPEVRKNHRKKYMKAALNDLTILKEKLNENRTDIIQHY